LSNTGFIVQWQYVLQSWFFRFLICFITARQVTIPLKIYRCFLRSDFWSDKLIHSIFFLQSWYLDWLDLILGCLTQLDLIVTCPRTVFFLNVLAVLYFEFWIWSDSICQILSHSSMNCVITSPVFCMDLSYKGLRISCRLKFISWSISEMSWSFLSWLERASEYHFLSSNSKL